MRGDRADEGSGLTLEVVDRDGVVLVCAQGEIDLASTGRLARVLAPFTDRPVMLDLSQVSYLDAAGIGVLVETDRRLRARDARLVVHAPTPLVRRLLEITGDDDLIEQV